MIDDSPSSAVPSPFDTLYLRYILRLLSTGFRFIALPCISIGYILHSIPYVDAGFHSAAPSLDVGRMIQVVVVGGLVSIFSILYLHVVAERAVFHHTLHHMQLRDVFLFWLLCLAYLSDAVLSATYSHVYRSCPHIVSRLLYVSPYAVFLGVYFVMIMPTGKTHGDRKARSKDSIDLLVPQVSLRLLDAIVLVGVCISLWGAWKESGITRAHPQTLLETVTPKHWAILLCCGAVALGDVFRHWIATRTLVWESYQKHLGHCLLLERKLADFEFVPEGKVCDLVVDVGCGGGERLIQLLRDERIPFAWDRLMILACDRQFTSEREESFKKDLILGTDDRVSAGNVECRDRIPNLDKQQDKDLLPMFCRGTGFTVVHVSHALYYRELTRKLQRLLQQIPGDVVVVVRGSGQRSFWSIVESIMSTKAVRPSAGQFWRVRYLPELAQAAGLVRLVDPRIELQGVGESPDDILDQAILWDEAAAASALELLSIWHGTHIRDVLSTVAYRLTQLDRKVFVPAEDVQFWFRRKPSELSVRVRGAGELDYKAAGEVLHGKLAFVTAPVYSERRASDLPAPRPSPEIVGAPVPEAGAAAPDQAVPGESTPSPIPAGDADGAST